MRKDILIASRNPFSRLLDGLRLDGLYAPVGTPFAQGVNFSPTLGLSPRVGFGYCESAESVSISYQTDTISYYSRDGMLATLIKTIIPRLFH